MKKLFLLIILSIIPKVSASTIVMETDTNKILYADNIHNVRSVASISKVMTAIIALENGNLDEEITIGDEIDGAYGSAIYIKKGEVLTLRDLLYGLMLRSGNDAALAISHNISGSVTDFVKLMNEKAKELGMKNTTFNNPSGLDNDKGNYSTCYDMAILSSYAIKNSEYRKIVGTKKYKLKTNMNTYIWENKNRLLKEYKYSVGGKTGYTINAKRTLVTNAIKDDLSLTIVTLNEGDDFNKHKALYEEYFKEYKSVKILKKGNLDIVDENYYKNRKFYINSDFSYPIKDDSILLKIELIKKTNIKDNDKVGVIKVLINNEEVYETDIFISIKKEKITLIELLKKILNGK